MKKTLFAILLLASGLAQAADPGTCWIRSFQSSSTVTAEFTRIFSDGSILAGGILTGTGLAAGPTVLSSQGGQDSWVGRYRSSDGAPIWALGYGSTGEETFVNAAIGPGDHIYVVATISGVANFGCGPLTVAGGNDIALARLDPLSGACVWSRSFGGTLTDQGTAIAVDSADNVYMGAYFVNTVDFGGTALTSYAGGADMVLAKYTNAGTLVWAKRFANSGFDVLNGLAVDSAGNILMDGYYTGNLNLGGLNLGVAAASDIFIGKLTNAGAHIWSRRIGGMWDDIAYGIVPIANGNVGATGTIFLTPVDFGGGYILTPASEDIWTAAFSSIDGSTLWAALGTGNMLDTGYAVAAGPDNSLTMTGRFIGTFTLAPRVLKASGTASDEDGVIASYDGTTGGLLTAVDERGTADALGRGRGIVITSTNEIVAVGLYKTALDVAQNRVTCASTGSCGFLVKLSTKCPTGGGKRQRPVARELP